MSQGQRFRRRALRRGYKVDEVDSFLDRVEATLSGDPAGAPVSAQEVHDVVFRVRYGGYDEWQVDLHLDRVERQLAEMEERGGAFSRQADNRVAAQPPQDRMPQDRMPQDRMHQDRMPPDRMPPPPDRMGPPDRMPPVERMAPPPMPSRPVPPMPPPSGPPREPTFSRYDEPTYAGPGSGYDNGGFEPPRPGRADMTAEIRMGGAPPPEPGYGGNPGGFGGGGPGPGGSLPTEAARVDQLRRTFQLRRFGSGYDRTQVDRLFDGVISSMSGRSGPIGDAELDPGQFNLVPGGYFEAEVDAALKEVRDILTRRR